MTGVAAVAAVVAQCSTYVGSDGFQFGDLQAALSEMAFRDAVFCTFSESMGALAAGLLFFGAISTFLTIRTGSPIIPLILTVLLGPLVLLVVPSTAIGLFVLVLLLAGGIGPILVIRRMDLV